MLEPDITTQIAETLSGVVVKLKRKLRERATLGDHSPSHIAVLVRLEREGPATSAKLAQAEGMRPQSMSAIVQALQGEGLIKTTAEGIIILDPAGLSAVTAAQPRVTKVTPRPNQDH